MAVTRNASPIWAGAIPRRSRVQAADTAAISRKMKIAAAIFLAAKAREMATGAEK